MFIGLSSGSLIEFLSDLEFSFPKETSIFSEFDNDLTVELIANMNLDENLDEEEKKDDEQNNDDKQNKPDNQEKQAKEKEDKQEEMSIDSGMPDLENEAKESDQAEEDVEIEDSSQPDLRKKGKSSLGDLNYKTYTEEFDEIIKAEELENTEELTRLRKNLDQQLLRENNLLIQEDEKPIPSLYTCLSITSSTYVSKYASIYCPPLTLNDPLKSGAAL